MLRNKILFTAILLIIVVSVFGFLSFRQQIDYNADVKPILNKKCISCHGGVTAKNGFSVLFREEALGATQSGKPAIVPGYPGKSEMIRRLSLNDPEERMPYKHEPLDKEEIDILTKWIKQGAKWGDHWAYVSVAKPNIPSPDHPFSQLPIDQYIHENLIEKSLTPSVQADKATLLRRVSLDLIGMYPSEGIAHAFLESKDMDKAYESLVDSLLASAHFGERWAAMWLDIARYADTKGYESDGGRDIWQYRDWVINAFNSDMPYNQFIEEQIAGDLLQAPTDDQYIATAFHRNTMTNDEGGTVNEEFRVAAVMDRVNTTWEGIMGTTFACVQCHSHPYDPFKHEEYYKFMAYFNNTRDEDVPPEYPLLRHFTESQQDSLDAMLTWAGNHAPPADVKALRLLAKTGQPALHSSYADALENSAIGNNNYALFLRNKSLARLNGVGFDASNLMIVHYNANKSGGTMQLHLDSAKGPLLASWKVNVTKGYENVWIEYPLQQGKHDVYITYNNPALGNNPGDFVVFFDWFHFGKVFPGQGKPDYDANKNILKALMAANRPTTPVMIENPAGLQRKTYLFDRGAWTAPTKEVTAGVPATLAYAMPENAPPNRKGLSMWLTDRRNPLVSRTMANRLWEQLFGAGIVETLEDMGSQGLPPTHKELLDYLAYQLMNEHQWSVKKMLKEMVMSYTYRQESKMTDLHKDKDAFNRYYARGPRKRLLAEQIRDQHLCISGALNTKMYGPGVMPWQPEGIWLSPYNGATWVQSKNGDENRRAIYTYWKRTAPYPSMIAFDGAQRIVCNARRIATNTPLQALTTLNDSVYLNMARQFAYRMHDAAPQAVASQITAGYKMMLFKNIDSARLGIFESLYRTALSAFEKDAEKTCEMVGEQNKYTSPATAALVVVANALLNVDEVIMTN